jgi:23S rRNA pseudouridine2605 synthase
VFATPAYVVKPGDKISVDGKPLPEAAPARLWRYHKPRGLVTSHKDPQGRRTVFEALPPGLPRVVSVGRLDINTEGLLLLTTDGELARHLELPSTGWLRRYRVRAHGRVTQQALDALRDGVTIDGVRYGPVDARIDREQGSNLWLTIALREGKNREVKRIAELLGLTVNRLIRISFGPFPLGELAEGAVEEVKRKVLADQLGTKLAEQFGLFDAARARRARRR